MLSRQPHGTCSMQAALLLLICCAAFSHWSSSLLCSQEEIVNACGVDDIHDGVNYVRTACVIAVSKSKEIFEPLIHQASQPFFCTTYAYHRHSVFIRQLACL
jgi:hypothetical protein